MIEKEFIDSSNIINKIDEFEEYVERLYLSSKVSYDEKYHRSVIKKYSELVNDIENSSLSKEDKCFALEVVVELFNEYKTLNY